MKPEAWDDDETVCHLAVLAHRLEVPLLLRRCEARAVARLNEQNVSERLMMADVWGLAGLKTACLDFLETDRQRLGRVQATEGFGRLLTQRPRLLAEILAKTAPPPVAPKRPAPAAELPEDLDQLTVVRLKQLCADRGLPTSGLKPTLLQRLRDSAA